MIFFLYLILNFLSNLNYNTNAQLMCIEYFLLSYTSKFQLRKLKNSRILPSQDAVPLDSWISNSCSATMIQESASRDEAELSSFGELSISVVHCTSGIIPTWSMSWSAGDRYLATVTNRADPSCNSVTLCKKKKVIWINAFMSSYLSFTKSNT